MRYLCLTLATLIVALTATVSAQPFVIVNDSMTGGRCGLLDQYFETSLYLSIYNPGEVQKELHFTVLFSDFYIDSLSFHNGFDTLWKVIGENIDIGYPVIDTTDDGCILQVSCIHEDVLPEPFTIPGLPTSLDTITYLGVHGRAWSNNGDAMCVDSTLPPNLREWLAEPGPAIAFGGQTCFPVSEPRSTCCNPGPLWPRPDTLFVADACSPLQQPFYFRLEGPDGGPEEPIYPYYLEVAEGPGEIRWADTYIFEPSPGDAGTVIPVRLNLLSDPCGDSSLVYWWESLEFYLVIGDSVEFDTDGPAKFALREQTAFVARSGEPLEIKFEPENAGPCYNQTYGWRYHAQDPEPPGISFDASTGTLTYSGTPADTGRYFLYMDVFEYGDTTDTHGFYIYHYDQWSCGNCNHKDEVDVADLTWLISFLFMQGPEPIPMEAGEVDCQGVIDVGDLTVMISYLFITFENLCDGC